MTELTIYEELRQLKSAVAMVAAKIDDLMDTLGEPAPGGSQPPVHGANTTPDQASTTDEASAIVGRMSRPEAAGRQESEGPTSAPEYFCENGEPKNSGKYAIKIEISKSNPPKRNVAPPLPQTQQKARVLNIEIRRWARDDLEAIKGLDRAALDLLSICDVTRFAQVAAFNADDVAKFNAVLGDPGRITRQNWIEQAAILAAGGTTAFAAARERGIAEVVPARNANVVPLRARLGTVSTPQVPTRCEKPTCTSIAVRPAASAKVVSLGTLRVSPVSDMPVQPVRRRHGALRSAVAMIALTLLGTCYVGVESAALWRMAEDGMCQVEGLRDIATCHAGEVYIAETQR